MQPQAEAARVDEVEVGAGTVYVETGGIEWGAGAGGGMTRLRGDHRSSERRVCGIRVECSAQCQRGVSVDKCRRHEGNGARQVQANRDIGGRCTSLTV
jgi:hypothetical protein